jgi:carbonic anhydrase
MTPTRVRRLTAAALAGGMAALSLALASRAQEREPALWSYSGDSGPAQWAALDPNYKACGRGKSQSPVDIVDPAEAQLPPLQFAYQWKLKHVSHNGHAIQVDPEPGSWLRVGEQRFELQELHFHTPSETRIEGKRYPLEAHYFHKGAGGTLLMLAVLFEDGPINPSVGKILSTSPWSTDQIDASKLRVTERELLPAERGYFLYNGSLTTPPCTEDVRWIVLGAPLAVAASQIRAFEQIVGRNARELQPLHSRIVLR